MFRQPGSTMSAVSIVYSMYDGPVPADVMEQACAEDEAYRANPQRFEMDAARSNVAYNTRCARQSIARIRAATHPLTIASERDMVLRAHLRARRQYQAELRRLCSAHS